MHNYQTILVATDFSAHSEEALARGLQLAQVYHATLHVLHVVEIPTYPVLEDIAVTGLPGIWDPELSVQITEESNKQLHHLLEQAGLSQKHGRTLQGIASEEIVTYANQIRAELIVMGKYGVSGWKRLLGSTTDSVLHHADCDVLAIKLENEK